jgi:hypothetical protein
VDSLHIAQLLTHFDHVVVIHLRDIAWRLTVSQHPQPITHSAVLSLPSPTQPLYPTHNCPSPYNGLSPHTHTFVTFSRHTTTNNSSSNNNKIHPISTSISLSSSSPPRQQQPLTQTYLWASTRPRFISLPQSALTTNQGCCPSITPVPILRKLHFNTLTPSWPPNYLSECMHVPSRREHDHHG